MSTIVWPLCSLTPRETWWSPTSGSVRSGGRTLNGSPRVANWQAGGLWRCRLAGIFVRTPDQILTMQAMEGILDGGATPIAVPRWPGRQAPHRGLLSYTPFSDGSPFSDGTEFLTTGPGAALVEPVIAYETTVTLDRPEGANPLRGGEDFAFDYADGPHLHRIIGIVSTAVVGDMVRYEVSIRPPTRGPLSEGAPANFETPHCLMRLSNAADFAAVLEYNRFGLFDAEFVEA